MRVPEGPALSKESSGEVPVGKHSQSSSPPLEHARLLAEARALHALRRSTGQTRPVAQFREGDWVESCYRLGKCWARAIVVRVCRTAASSSAPAYDIQFHATGTMEMHVPESDLVRGSPPVALEQPLGIRPSNIVLVPYRRDPSRLRRAKVLDSAVNPKTKRRELTVQYLYVHRNVDPSSQEIAVSGRSSRESGSSPDHH